MKLGTTDMGLRLSKTRVTYCVIIEEIIPFRMTSGAIQTVWIV